MGLCSTKVKVIDTVSSIVVNNLPINLDKYKYNRDLFSGTFANVYLFELDNVSMKNNKIVLKIYKEKYFLKNKNMELFMEINIIKMLSCKPHQNIIMCRLTKCNKIITEYCEGGDLYSLYENIGIFPEDVIILYFKDIINGLSHLNSLNIIHRDIKPENILLSTGNIAKICDFNLCDYGIDLKKRQIGVGTKYYRAPEVVWSSYYDKNCDVWSLGTMLYVLTVGKYPYSDNNEPYELDLIIKNKRWYKLSSHFRAIIEDMLEYYADLRITLDGIKRIDWYCLI